MNKRWEIKYKELAIFKKKFGHCDVPRNLPLGVWVAHQRLGKYLTEEKKKKLDELDFNWAPRLTSWEKKLSELKEFKIQYGHCDVPETYHDKALKNWVSGQRAKRKVLSADKRKKLSELGITWVLIDKKWENKFKELLKFKKLYGHVNVPLRYGLKRSLGAWVYVQRRRKNKLPPDHRKRLEKLGFIWNAREDLWNNKFVMLKEFHKKHGHCRVPTNHENKVLCHWVNTLRQSRTRQSPERLKKLAELDFNWPL